MNFIHGNVEDYIYFLFGKSYNLVFFVKVQEGRTIIIYLQGQHNYFCALKRTLSEA